jgi:hypothetical protein
MANVAAGPWLPAESVALHATIVVPTGNSVPPPGWLEGYTGWRLLPPPTSALHSQRPGWKLHTLERSTVSLTWMMGKSTLAPAAPGAASRCQGRPLSSIVMVGARESRKAAPSAAKPSLQWQAAVPLTLMHSQLAGQPEVPSVHSSMSGWQGQGEIPGEGRKYCVPRYWGDPGCKKLMGGQEKGSMAHTTEGAPNAKLPS